VKRLFKTVSILLISFAFTASYATTCKATINCETSGYKVINQFYYAHRNQGVALCLPSSEGENNCTFYNSGSECGNPSLDIVTFFKREVAPHQDENVEKCESK